MDKDKEGAANPQAELSEEDEQKLIDLWERRHQQQVQFETEHIAEIYEQALCYQELNSVDEIYQQYNLRSGSLIHVHVESYHEQDGESDSFTFEAHGSYRKEGDRHIIAYEMTEEGEMVPGMTRIFYDEKNKTARMEREGRHSTKLYFCPEHIDVTIYNTPYGQMKLRVLTKKLSFEQNEEGGRIHIDYNIFMPMQTATHTVLKLSYRFR